MESARCRLCGHRHAGLNHIWDKPPPDDEVPAEAPEPEATPPRPKAPSYARYKTFDKTTYQRLYMRERRKRMREAHRAEQEKLAKCAQ